MEQPSPRDENGLSIAVRSLNPKLTGRRAVRPLPPPIIDGHLSESEYEESDSSSDDEYDGKTPPITSRSGSVVSDESSVRKIRSLAKAVQMKNKAHKEEVERANPGNGNNRLQHNGKFIKKEFNMGRPIPMTGIWSCCGEKTALGMYCESKKARLRMAKVFDDVNRAKTKEMDYKETKKAVKATWDSKKGEPSHDRGPSAEDIAMENAARTDSSFNAPMLSSWLYKNVTEEPTVTSGMNFLQKHLESGEGCTLMLKHDILGAIRKVHEFYKDHPPLQLHCIIAIRKLLDCNFTRDDIITNDTYVLQMAFNIGLKYVNSKEHIEEVARCMSQCTRSEICRRYIMHRRLYAYVITWCKKYQNTPTILRSALRLFNWVATTPDRIKELCDSGNVVPVVIRVMKKHLTSGMVLGPGMLFLTRASSIHSPAMACILRMKATPLMIKALMALYSDAYLQLEGLKMIQTISKTAEGWKQISETRGGWQNLTQGTPLGNALVHDLPGALHNPGWAIGDTPHLPVSDQQKMKASAIFSKRSSGGAASVSWTAHGLRDFMGISMKETKLAVNTEYHDMYFELLTTLELMPQPGEEREYWFVRIKDYEKENDIMLEEMVNTMLDLKKKEAFREKQVLIELQAPADEQTKEVFVNGVRVTTKMLTETDLTLEELMNAGVEGPQNT